MFLEMEPDQLHNALEWDEFCNDRADGRVYAFMTPDELDELEHGKQISRDEWLFWFKGVVV